jgi:heme exporter protein D
MDMLSSFFTMGGYGSFVWPAYLLAVLVMGGVVAASLRAAKVREAELDGLQRMRPARRTRRQTQPSDSPAPESPVP